MYADYTTIYFNWNFGSNNLEIEINVELQKVIIYFIYM